MTTLDDDGAAAAAQTTKQFAGRMMSAIDGASVAILASIGHQTGLFDTMAGLPPSTSPQIARVAGLNERYVREWLGGMVVARVVDYDPFQRTYVLPSTTPRYSPVPRDRITLPGSPSSFLFSARSSRRSSVVSATAVA
jgi:Rv2258c-like winged HTH domain